MKAKEIMQKLFEWTPTDRACGSDRLIFGYENKEISRAAVYEIKTDIEEKLGLRNVRVVGDKNNVCKTVSMPVGAYLPESIIAELNCPSVDMVITGEITEYSVCEYVRDVAASGEKKTLLLLGHMGSEKSGMEYICEYLQDTVNDVEFRYIECKEVY